MAKKKAARRRVAPPEVTLRFISDPGHGWLEVPESLCKVLGLGTDFTSRGGFCYLEEDCECTDFDRAAKRKGVTSKTIDHDVDSFDHWLSGDQWPYIPAAIYRDDISLVCAALEVFGNQRYKHSLDETYSYQERQACRKMWEDSVRLILKFTSMTGKGGE